MASCAPAAACYGEDSGFTHEVMNALFSVDLADVTYKTGPASNLSRTQPLLLENPIRGLCIPVGLS